MPGDRWSESWSVLDLAAADKAATKGLSLLRRSFLQAADGEGGGWYHELAGPHAGPTATAVGLLAFHILDQKFDRTVECVRFLRSRQVKSSVELFNGGWATNASPGHPVVESTAWVVRMLVEAGHACGESAPDLDAAVTWLVLNQNLDGGWGSLLGNRSRIWTTCLALRALSRIKSGSQTLEKGIGWLRSEQHSSGGWGQLRASESIPTVTHTCMSLLALADAGESVNGAEFDRAFSWLDGRLDRTFEEDRNARVEMYDVMVSSPDQTQRWRNTVPHYGLPYALSALLLNPNGARPVLVSGAVRKLLESQLAEGRWPSVEGGSLASIWSLYPHLEAVARLRGWSPVRFASKITLLPRAAVIQYDGERVASLAELVRAQRRASLGAALARYWSTLLLSTTLVLGLVGVISGRFEWRDFWLGVALPVALFLAQEFRHRMNTRRSIER